MESKGKQGYKAEANFLSMRCLSCGGRAYLTEKWRPPKGIDPDLREFKCKCGVHSYCRQMISEIREGVYLSSFIGL